MEMKLKDICEQINDRISSDDVGLSDYVTTDCILQNKAGRTIATNLPPQKCNLTHYKKGDVLIANIRPYLKKIWFADSDGGCSSDVLAFRAKTNHTSEFLYAVLLQDSFYDYVMKATKGSKMPRGDINHIMNFPIISDKLNEAKIGKLITLIDKKIALNREINRNLEELAKQIYDYWFVQFDFPNKEGKPYKTSGGKMVYNEILKREIPDGWEVKEIEDFCHIFTGKKDVNQSFDFGKYKFFSCAPGFRFSNEKLYEGKAILISGNGSYTGRTIFVNDAFDLYQRTYAVVLKNNNTDFLEYIFHTAKRFLTLKVGGGTHGSAIPYIVYDDIAKERFLFSKEVIDKFQKIIIPNLSEISKKEKEILELTALRDSLLPLLMNGQVTLK